MKSLLFKTAWKLVKQSGKTMSEALTIAWASFKQGADVVISTCWKGQKWVTFAKSIGNARYTCPTLSELKATLENHVNYNNDGAKYDYNVGIFNND